MGETRSSRSRSPAPDKYDPSRHRSRSPRRREDKQKRSDRGGGFKWKEKRSRNDEADGERGAERKPRKRSRSPRRRKEPEAAPERKQQEKPASAAPAAKPPGNSVEDKFGVARKFGNKGSVEDKFGVSAKFGTSASKPVPKNSEENTGQAPERAAAIQQSSGGYQEPMIKVFVNDRLGTRAEIPCLASDPVKLFKAQVAARIGRQPHEIMLKRQGERPFKNQLTLEDYGVSNGVQLDLEIDTGE
ncbi:ubiquitin-related domain-containing protein [Calycina marina]|uniref:Ubiquitin-like modifier HUB1 n=1 Tax=Calycina marina TaxID=1763456 RepID=A0A9P7Z6I1_9HELO|nr:ubiquitin-related domain-containing protein [Calycina marina]